MPFPTKNIPLCELGGEALEFNRVYMLIGLKGI